MVELLLFIFVVVKLLLLLLLLAVLEVVPLEFLLLFLLLLLLIILVYLEIGSSDLERWSNCLDLRALMSQRGRGRYVKSWKNQKGNGTCDCGLW